MLDCCLIEQNFHVISNGPPNQGLEVPINCCCVILNCSTWDLLYQAYELASSILWLRWWCFGRLPLWKYLLPTQLRIDNEMLKSSSLYNEMLLLEGSLQVFQRLRALFADSSQWICLFKIACKLVCEVPSRLETLHHLFKEKGNRVWRPL